MTKQWFETWFDTPFYHLLYNNRDEQEASNFIDRLLGFLKIEKQSKVLDVGCGKGRHARHIHQHGMNVVGVDLSPESILFANQSASDSLRFEVGDMRSLAFSNEFDLVVNLFSSFGYFEDNSEDKAALKSMVNALKEGGLLVLDYMHPEIIVKEMKPREIINKGAIQFHISKQLIFPFIIKDIHFLANGVDYHFQEKLKVIKPMQFEKYFADLGCDLVAMFGDYQLHDFNSKQSKRQIWVVKKKYD
jgi:SAM-dependent methyltransferase